MWNSLIELDHYLFAKINLDWTNGVFDWFFPFITDLHKSAGFRGFVAALILVWIYKQRMHAVRWLVFVILCVGAADLTAYRIVKPIVGRARPEMAGVVVHLRTYHTTDYSFPSNHATNNFAAATALSFAYPPAAPIFFTIACLVGYSRVYVGVHFPLDVISGALIGIALAYILRRLLARWLPKGRAS